MSTPGAVRAGLLDLRAGWHHFASRLATTVRDPLAVAVLLLAGLLTVPLWTIVGLGSVVHLVATAEQSQVRPRLLLLCLLLVYVELLLTVLVALTVTGRVTHTARGVTTTRAVPALPIGGRTRLVVEAMAGLVLVAAARVLVLVVGGGPLRDLLGQGSGAPAVVARASALGLLSSFPLVLAWLATARLDRSGLVRPLLAAGLGLLAAFAGAMAQPWAALATVLLLSALLLIRLDDGERAAAGANQSPATITLQPRVSPGPLRQFRADAWQRPLLKLWPFAVGVIPLLVLDLAQLERYAFFVFLQLLVLAALVFFPFGLPLVRRGAPLFSGQMQRAWSPLPVPGEQVNRAVYLHALIASGSVWLLLLVQAVRHRGDVDMVAFELPSVLLVAAAVLCETVGDRRRGLLAVGSLVGLHLAPIAFLVLNAAFELPASLSGPQFDTLIIGQGYAIGLIGALPPLVHLRRRVVRSAA